LIFISVLSTFTFHIAWMTTVEGRSATSARSDLALESCHGSYIFLVVAVHTVWMATVVRDGAVHPADTQVTVQ
jgi:hypothetical protein